MTAAAGLDCGRLTPESRFVDPGYCEVYGNRVNNDDNPTSLTPTATSAFEALKYSINSVFCNIGKR